MGKSSRIAAATAKQQSILSTKVLGSAAAAHGQGRRRTTRTKHKHSDSLNPVHGINEMDVVDSNSNSATVTTPDIEMSASNSDNSFPDSDLAGNNSHVNSSSATTPPPTVPLTSSEEITYFEDAYAHLRTFKPKVARAAPHPNTNSKGEWVLIKGLFEVQTAAATHNNQEQEQEQEQEQKQVQVQEQVQEQTSYKVGMPIILLRNVDQKKGLCNGTRLIVRHLKPRCIMATILTGPFATDLVFIPRVPIVTTDDKSSPIMFKRRQFPVKPAFAMTINKSQGQTLENVGLYLPTPVFTHGQLYVALSRCTDEKNLKVLIIDGTIPGLEGTYTRNVVYKNVL